MAGAKKRQTNLKDNASKVSRKGKMMRVSAGVLSVLLCLVAVGYKLWLDGAFTKLPPGNLRVGNQAQPKQAAKRKSYENVADLSDEHFFEREEKHKDVFDKDYMKLDGVIFENLSSQTVQLWWANPTGHDALQGTLKPSETFTVNTWMGHNFYFTPEGTKGTMEDSLYSVMMESTARIVLYDEMERTAARSRFNREHFHRTGREWKNFWPREPVTHPYHRAKIGEKIVKESDRSQFFVCIDDQLDQETISALDAMEEMSEWDPKTNPAPPAFQVENDGYFIGRMNGTTYCREKMDPEQLLSWDLINICDQGPNAFRIYNFISDDEIEHIKNLGMDLGMTRSTQGAEKIMSATRTSQTVWIDRDASFIVDNIVRRIADMVNIPQQKLFLNASAESLQLVHYFGGEMYKAHHGLCFIHYILFVHQFQFCIQILSLFLLGINLNQITRQRSHTIGT